MNGATHKDSFQQTCLKALRKEGAKVTHARVAVIRALSRASRPMSPKDVMEEVRRVSPTEQIDLVSIYRTLDKLSELELVHKVPPSGSFLPCRHAACGHERHVMMSCRGCSRITECDVSESTVLPLLDFLAKEQGFTVTGKTLQLDGLCEDCK